MKATVSVALLDKTVEISAPVYGVWAVTGAFKWTSVVPDPLDYEVTHVPTGLCVHGATGYMPFGVATLLAELLSMVAPFDAQDAHKAESKQIIRDACAYVLQLGANP